jgi:hypothetical protein
VSEDEPVGEDGPRTSTLVLGVAAIVAAVILVFFALGYVLGRLVL